MLQRLVIAGASLPAQRFGGMDDTFGKRDKTTLPQAQVVDEEMFKSCLRALTKRMAALG